MATEQQVLQAGNIPMPVDAQFSLRDGMTALIGDMFRKYHDAMAMVLGVEFPDGIEDAEGRIAYLSASVLLGMRDGRILDDPTQPVTRKIKDAEMYGDPYTVEEQDAMAMCALDMLPFWGGKRSANVSEVFWSMVYTGTGYCFEGILRRDRERAREAFVREFCSEQIKNINAEYDAAMKRIQSDRRRVPVEVEQRMREIVKAEKDAADAAEAEWNRLYRGPLGDHPTPRDIRLQEESDEAWDRYQAAKDELNKAIRERYPEYFEAGRKTAAEFEQAVADANNARNEAIGTLRAEAIAEFERRYSKL